MGQVIDELETAANGFTIHAGQIVEINVVNRVAAFAIIIAIDEIDDRTANPANAGNVQLHRAGFNADGLSALIEQVLIGLAGIADPEPHATGARSMLAREIPGGGTWLIIGDEIDAALAPQLNILGAMARDLRKAHGFEDGLEHAFFRG